MFFSRSSRAFRERERERERERLERARASEIPFFSSSLTGSVFFSFQFFFFPFPKSKTKQNNVFRFFFPPFLRFSLSLSSLCLSLIYRKKKRRKKSNKKAFFKEGPRRWLASLGSSSDKTPRSRAAPSGPRPSRTRWRRPCGQTCPTSLSGAGRPPAEAAGRS